LGVKN